jgi:3-hydroxymyristoyl/3-hydroxydecanoyl-(acyl carrier protein) dehydratase
LCDALNPLNFPGRSAQSEFLDRIDIGSNLGKFNLGYAHGTKQVVKDDWFFSCHFWNDPVMVRVFSSLEVGSHFWRRHLSFFVL